MRLENTCKRWELAYLMFWHCDSVGLTEILLINVGYNLNCFHVHAICMRQGRIYVENECPTFVKTMSIVSHKFCAKLS